MRNQAKSQLGSAYYFWTIGSLPVGKAACRQRCYRIDYVADDSRRVIKACRSEERNRQVQDRLRCEFAASPRAGARVRATAADS